MKTLGKKLVGDGSIEVRAFYEAGADGLFASASSGAGVPCDVIAPALIPQNAGERLKPTGGTQGSLRNSLGPGC